MSVSLSFDELMEYTEWQRAKWHDWFLKQGDQSPAHSAGPHGDGCFQCMGDLVRHIFSAKMRYVDRLLNRELTDTASIPNNNVEALFQFGTQSSEDLTKFIQAFPAADWDVMREFDFMKNILRATPRKIVAHVLLHEIRHWAQIATLYRLNGMGNEAQDFLFSPVLGGELKRVAS
jgi:uncharacterized damage-inducible protein DinB